MNQKKIMWIILSLFIIARYGFAQQADKANLERGINFIETQVYTAEEDAKILKAFEGLRVADVSDGMDRAGLPDQGLVDPGILPLWKDLDDMSHQIRGIAITARYVPTLRKRLPDAGQAQGAWEGQWYSAHSSEAWGELIRPGTVIVLDDVETADCGSIGSYNILTWFKAGAVGVVTDASSRDTDEVIKERVPLYLRRRGRGIRPGRNELESVNRPVVIGGVLVCPGDVVVGDGDGVIVVPRAVALDVAKQARGILDSDKQARRTLYESMNRELDQTVQ